MVSVPFIVMIVALLLGVPIPFALGIAGMLGIWLITGDISMVMNVLGTAPFANTADYIMTTIPMYILMAHFSSSSGLAEDLFLAASKLLSHIRGGLAIATVFACGIFGAMSGASVAAASVMSKIALPNMRRFGYSEVLASGTVAVGSCLDTFIPPSVGMVVYGIVTDTSIGKLLIAGIVPGIIIGIFLVLTILIWVTVNPSHAPKTQRASWGERWGSLRGIWPSILLIFVVLGLLYTGIATPTEVGAIGAFMSAVIGLTMGRLTWAGIVEALKETISSSVMIFIIIIGAQIFGTYIVLSQVPQKVVAVVTEMNVNRWVVIVGIVAAYFIISMFMDEIPLLLITLQIAFPLVIKLGFNPIWFGVLSMLMVSMGLVFPPVGMAAFIVSATGNVDLVKVYRGTSILVIALVLTTICMMIFPQIALWLPSTMR